MSITVRSYSPEDLEIIRTCKDKFLSTVFMNRKTFSAKEIAAYPYYKRRTYLITFEADLEPLTIYATDDENLKKFLDAEYDISKIVCIVEQKTTYRNLEI